MTNKQHNFYRVICILFGLLSGIAGTAFALGTERQKVRDCLSTNAADISRLNEELSNSSNNVLSQIEEIQSGISNIIDRVNEINIDLQVLKAIVERMEKSFNKPDKSG